MDTRQEYVKPTLTSHFNHFNLTHRGCEPHLDLELEAAAGGAGGVGGEARVEAAVTGVHIRQAQAAVSVHAHPLLCTNKIILVALCLQMYRRMKG